MGCSQGSFCQISVPGIFFFLLFPGVSPFNVSTYLNKYQLENAIEGSKPKLRCQNNGWVVEGHADFSQFPTGDGGSPLPFLKESHRQGFHCQCPEGFTGLLCARPYEICGEYAGSLHLDESMHVCFNHGKCIEGQETLHPDQQFCDCTEAEFRGKKVYGKYCEKSATEAKPCDQLGSQFCVHGECQTDDAGDETASRDVCQCEEGWTGSHCEFLSEDKPECDIDCGPGVCQETYADYDDPSDYHQYWRHNINHTFCSCPPGRSGTTCEISEEELASGSRSSDICDDSLENFCLNGGVCKANHVQTPEQPCSCPVGFEGPHCEFEEGQAPECTLDCKHEGICTLGIQSLQDVDNYTSVWEQSVNRMYCKCREGYHGRNCEVDLTNLHSSKCGEPPNELFCFDGVCETDETTQQPFCHCKRGFVGESCQYRQDEVPDCEIDCKHGTCAFGVKELENGMQQHINFTYCNCDPGWYGTTCEVQGIQCGSKTCLGEGTSCATTDDGVDFCNCSSSLGADSKDALAFAGESCEFESTAVCITSTETYFCYNGGNCSSTNAGCDCADGFNGPVCEYKSGMEPDCSLNCQNGGVCKKGNKYISNLTKKPELAFLQVFSNDNFGSEHCLCKDGFVGNMCETKVEICGDDNHLCLHGSKCLEEEDGSYRCDCESAFTSESRYAGKFCQHHHTDICDTSGELLFDGSAADLFFCVNDGVCRKPGSPGYPGCDCGPLYFGSRCEFSIQYEDGSRRRSNKRVPYRTGTIIYLFFIFICSCIAALVGWRVSQRMREVEESKKWTEESLAPISQRDSCDDLDSIPEDDSPTWETSSRGSPVDGAEIL